MRTAATLITLVALLAAACTPASEQEGRITGLKATIEALRATPTSLSGLQPVLIVTVFDGDSGVAVDANGRFEFRLYGIDAPERDDVSRAALASLIAEFGNGLYAEERDVDRYGRRVVVLQAGDGSRSVNVEMVRQGFAYAYLQYGELEGVVSAEAEARSNGRGVWRTRR